MSLSKRGKEKIAVILSFMLLMPRSVSASTQDISERPKLIFIQDIHSDDTAQKNIAQFIQTLMDRQLVDMVALEGAFTPIDFSAYHKFPHPEIVRQAAQKLLERKIISGPIYSALTTQTRLPLFIGIDSPAAYDANQAARLRAHSETETVKAWLKDSIAALEQEKSQVFNDELKVFDHEVNKYRSGTEELDGRLMAYLKVLKIKTKAPVDVEKLLKQMEVREARQYSSLSKTVQETQLIRDSRRLFLIEKLVNFSLTRDEWKEFKVQHRGKDQRLEAFEEFYHQAELRDGLMAANLINAIETRNSRVTVLVAGGFHYEGIRSRLEAHGIQVLTYRPHLIKTAKELFLAPSPINPVEVVKAIVADHQISYVNEPSRQIHEEALLEALPTVSLPSCICDIRELSYPDSTLVGRESVPAYVMDVIGRVKLAVTVWPELNGEPFSEDENRRFESNEGVLNLKDFHLQREQIEWVKQSTYDRSSGIIQLRFVVKAKDGSFYYLKFEGVNTTAVMENMEPMMTTLDDLNLPGAVAQISKGNHADLQGYFTIYPNGKKGWKFSGASNEHRQRKPFKVLIQYKNGERELAEITILEDLQSKNIRQISARQYPAGEHDPVKILNPDEVDFVMASYSVFWGNFKEYYNPTSDLRHLFRFPFVNDRPVFFGQITPSEKLMNAVFNWKPVSLPLIVNTEELRQTMIKMGYLQRDNVGQVLNPGDFCISNESIRVVLLPARYPVNGLAVSADGKRLSFVAVSGKSGRQGANYWELEPWLEHALGWKPAAFFIFDNGMDPSWRVSKSGRMTGTAVTGRTHVGSTMLLIPIEKAIPKMPSLNDVFKASLQAKKAT